ncbi:hypothetical protein [Pseudomonas sp. Leaf127]|uniref:hypothetical protein n=1 Tax=Pseudomonas sp. Leaf127 TaxID=1736267 RepID=UPI000B2411F9|nr:hypothetical protein [Pseudomonas sp. Leaf127]
MLKKLLLAAVPVLATSQALALDAQQWTALEPAVKAAVECRKPLTAERLKDVTPDSPGAWTLTPATAFNVLGLPVTRVEVFIDPNEELGASYTAVIEKQSLKKVQQQVKAASKKGLIGDLAAGQAHGPEQVEITCVVAEG